MILRKPYAILIKNFKLIHFILTIFMGYLFFKTNMIVRFFKEYLSSSATTISKEATNSLYGPILIISILVVIIGTLVILTLMKFKDKPIKFYIYNIFSHIYLAIVYYVSFTIVHSLETGLIEIRTIKFVYDLVVMAMLIEGISVAITAVRTTGFDIKSFNFKKDLEDLEIEDTDSEEFEVELEVDTDRFKRKFRQKMRHARYIYVENKLLLNISGAVVIAVICSIIYLSVGVYNKTFKLHQAFKTTQFIFDITNSYHTKYDYTGIEIKKDYQLVVVPFKVRKLTNLAVLKTGKFYLDIEGEKFYHEVKYKDRLFDIGSTYINQDISNEFNKYILVFEVPQQMIGKKMILKYSDTDNDVVKIDVTPNSLNKMKEGNEASLADTLDFSNSVLETGEIKINSYALAPSFTLNYNYCITSDNCYDSVEHLKPGVNHNHRTVLLKLDGKFTSENHILKTNNLFDFIQHFGEIHYQLNGESKTMNISFVEVLPKKTKTEDCYIEVVEELQNAEKVDIVFNIRNKIYTYHLK